MNTSTRLSIRIAPLTFKIFMLFVLAISVYGMKIRSITLFSTQFAYSDLALVAMLWLAWIFALSARSQPSPARTVFWLLVFILIYAFASTSWVTYHLSYWLTLYQVLLASATVLIPYLVSRLVVNDLKIDMHKLLYNFSIVLSVIFLYYISVRNNQNAHRLGGYLGTAAVISPAMIPVVAVFWTHILQKKKILVSLICAFITTAAVFLTQSRVALLSLILFGLLIALRKFSFKRLIAVVLPAILFVVLILQFASTDRYQSTDDPMRSINIDTGMRYAMQSASTFLFGNGYGSIWQWNAYQKGMLPTWSYPLMLTEHGYVLYHPHSVFVGLFAELGTVGTLPFIAVLFIIVREFWRSRKTDNELRTNVLGAIICTFPSLHTDLYIFRNWEVSIVWLFFLYTALSITKWQSNAKLLPSVAMRHSCGYRHDTRTKIARQPTISRL